ncbi:MAG: undecaprenyldiphospho-muramoylpentapeptide beta-N-acetylglucosaminyltransferase [Tissierellia bacterium]|nr:undecaprenyldiphospho-muramoylpentapeptide beta-N-acetylglucosaminyltransferase [Tissierellia bacterium]
MRLIISGGGTGGHIYPAVAILEEFKKRYEYIEILYMGTKDSMEEKIASNMNLNFKSIRVKGLPRKLNKNSVIAIKELIIGLNQAKKIIRDFQPDIVIGTGGFVSGPVLFRAATMGYKTMIHEQNSLPGLTNRILSRYVDCVAVTYESSKSYFKKPERVKVTGNPIRSNFNEKRGSKDSYIKYGLKDDKPIIFSFGGSNGSEDLNKAMAGLIKEYSIDLEFQIIHATGESHYDAFMKEIQGFDDNAIKVLPYIHDIASAYDISDLVITSSGAITLAELSLLGIASILIPKAYTTENHQEYNARLYMDIGASEMILEDELNSDLLYNKIAKLLENESTLSIMGENAKKLGNPNATSDIVDIAVSLLENKR